MQQWKPLIEYAVIGVLVPALIYWIIERTLSVDTYNQQLLAISVGVSGLIGFAIYKNC